MDKNGKFSYSKLETYEQCGYKYKLQYIDGHYVCSDNVATMFGSLVHKINELQTADLISGKSIDYDMLKSYFRSVNLPKKNKYDRDGDIFGANVLSQKYPNEWYESDKTGRSYADKTEQFLANGIHRQEDYMREHPELELVAAELPFEYNYRGYCFRGFIDRVLRHRSDNRHYVLHDLKTSSQAYDDKKCVTPLQFVIYCKALRQMYGEDIIVDCYYEFPIAEEMKSAGTKGFEARGMKKIDSLLDKIEAEDYTANPTPLCYWCAYSNTNPSQSPEAKNLCSYYSLWKPDAKTFATRLPWLGIEMDDQQHKKLIMLEQIESMNDFEI